MKKLRKLLIGLAGLSLSVGAAIGVGLNADKGAKEAKAETYSGKILVDTSYANFEEWSNQKSWREAGAKLAVYLFNNDVSRNVFLPVQEFNNTKGEYYINTFEYEELDFKPVNMIVCRMSSSLAVGTVVSEFAGNVWSQTPDLPIADIAIVAGNSCASTTQSFATVSGDIDFTFDILSRDETHSNHVMHGKSNVSVEIGDEFVVNYGTPRYALRDGVSASLFETVGTKIVARATGNFDFYFDTADSGDGAMQLWVEENSAAAATAFATTFLSTTNGICKDTSKVAEDTNVSDLAAVWNAKTPTPDGTSLVEKWNALTTAAKGVFAEGKENKTIEDAHDRYIHIMERYSATLTTFTGGPDFTPKGAIVQNPTVVGTNGDAALIAIIAISAISLLAVGGYFFIRKRKEDR